MPDPFPPASVPPSFSVETRFSLSEDEYFEAQKLYIRFKQSRALLLRRLAVGVLAVSLVVLYFTTPRRSFLQHPAVLLLVFLLIVLLVTPYGQLRALKKRFTIERAIFTDVSVELDEYGYHGSSAAGDGRMAWSAFDGYVEGQSVFALVRGFTFYPISKRSLSELERSQVAQLLQDHTTLLGRTPKPSRH